MGKLVATVLSRAYNHPLESRPRPQAASIWERSAYLIELLESCLAEAPGERPRNFGEVLRELTDEGKDAGGDEGQARVPADR